MTTISIPTFEQTLGGNPLILDVFWSPKYSREYCLSFQLQCNWQISEEDAEVFRKFAELFKYNDIGIYLEDVYPVQKIHFGYADTLARPTDDTEFVSSLAEIELINLNPAFSILHEEADDVEENDCFHRWDTIIEPRPPIHCLSCEISRPDLDPLLEPVSRSRVVVRFFSPSTTTALKELAVGG